MPVPDNLEAPCGLWYFGKSGTGKSHSFRRDYPDFYDKMANKWWDGYQNQPYVLIDDFDKKHEVLGYHLKRWADKYPFTAEIKGSARSIRPKLICVTSNWHPRDIFHESEVLEPILRRFKVVHFKRLGDLETFEHDECEERAAYVPFFKPKPSIPLPKSAMDLDLPPIIRKRSEESCWDDLPSAPPVLSRQNCVSFDNENDNIIFNLFSSDSESVQESKRIHDISVEYEKMFD